MATSRSTAMADLHGSWRLLLDGWRGTPLPAVADLRPARPASSVGLQIRWFALIGVASTLAYVALYALLREWVPATWANAAALLITAIGNTAANRRLTFGVRSNDGLVQDHAAGLLAFGLALGVMTASIGLLQALQPQSGRLTEVVVLVAANVAATVLRFVVLRAAILRRGRLLTRSAAAAAEGTTR